MHFSHILEIYKHIAYIAQVSSGFFYAFVMYTGGFCAAYFNKLYDLRMISQYHIHHAIYDNFYAA